MDQRWSRRDFLKTAAGSLAGLGLAPLLGGRAAGATSGGPRPSSTHAAAHGPRAGDLPPRVVGLRTLGGDFRFDPVGLRVEPGADLLWMNMGDFHTTTAFHPEYDDLLASEVPLRIPEEAEPWHSGMLGLTGGTEFTYTFEVPGVYDYFCQPHYSFGMVGRIIAGEPQGGPAVTRPDSELNEASQEQMPAVETVMSPAGRTFEWASRLNGLLPVHSADGDVAAAAGAVATAMEDDGQLRQAVSAAGQADRIGTRVERVVEGARQGVAYQELLNRIDAVKDALAEVR